MKTQLLIIISFFFFSCKDKDKKVDGSETIFEKSSTNDTGCFYLNDKEAILRFIDTFKLKAKNSDTLFYLKHIAFPLPDGLTFSGISNGKIHLKNEEFISKDEFIENFYTIINSDFVAKLKNLKLYFEEENDGSPKKCSNTVSVYHYFDSEACMIWTFKKINDDIILIWFGIAG